MALRNQHEEWHVTVDGDPTQWRGWCVMHDIKPLWIELNTFERQLMCAFPGDRGRQVDRGNERAASLIEGIHHSFNVVRIKHEVAPVKLDVSTHSSPNTFIETFGDVTPIYYECHVKLDGPFRPAMQMSSRDLFRAERWYVTRRQQTPFNAQEFVDMVRGWVALPDGWRGPSVVHSFEYEAALLDTNPNLDVNWQR
jgi:hypothetical protein